MLTEIHVIKELRIIQRDDVTQIQYVIILVVSFLKKKPYKYIPIIDHYIYTATSIKICVRVCKRKLNNARVQAKRKAVNKCSLHDTKHLSDDTADGGHKF